jgi:uncharacterized protein YqcC (DUF446 family)
MLSAQRERALSLVVDELEAELRRMELWEREPPSDAPLKSERPFCFDTLALSQWLQWMLIPRMREIFAGAGDLPAQSAIHPLAEDCFERLDDAGRLLKLIARFDRLIGDEAAAVTH